MRQRTAPAWKKLVKRLETGSDMESVEASKALSRCRSRNCMDALVHLMQCHGKPRVSESAAYSLALMGNRRFAKIFIACLRDPLRDASTRGQAAEGLVMCDGISKGTVIWKAAESELIAGLSDESPTVRFWCCFALGSLRSKRAIPFLEKIRDHDEGLLPGWWFVSEEAEDALEWIAGRPGSDRIPVHRRAKAEA